MILSDIQDGDLDVVLSLPLHQKNLYFSKLIKKHYPNVKESDPKKAQEIVEDMCKKLLANLVIENYKIIGTQ